MTIPNSGVRKRFVGAVGAASNVCVCRELFERIVRPSPQEHMISQTVGRPIRASSFAGNATLAGASLMPKVRTKTPEGRPAAAGNRHLHAAIDPGEEAGEGEEGWRRLRAEGPKALHFDLPEQPPHPAFGGRQYDWRDIHVWSPRIPIPKGCR